MTTQVFSNVVLTMNGGIMVGAKGAKRSFEVLRERFAGMSLKDIRAELRRKGELTVGEAALYLGFTSPQSLYNKISAKKRDPFAGPDGIKQGNGRGSRVRFKPEALEAWEKSRGEKLGEV